MLNCYFKISANSISKIGEASILTVVEEDNIQEFKINILKINDNKKSNKNSYIIAIIFPLFSSFHNNTLGITIHR